MPYTIDDLLSRYERMLLIRRFEEKVGELSTRGAFPGAVHLAIGQEAIAVGACYDLRTDDVVTSTHRGHHHIIAKGGDVRRMMAELAGKEEGYCRGRGGSMHIASMEVGILGANGIVGGGVPHAVGAAYAFHYRNEDRVAVGFFGDGGANEGVVHEAMNLAGIWKLPVVFVCENNQFAVSSAAKDMSAVRDIATRAAGYGFPGVIVDGSDLLDMTEAMAEAVERARAGEGPTLIEAKAHRLVGHYSAEAQEIADKYRSPLDLSRARAKDPIQRIGAVLSDLGTEETRMLAVESRVTDEVDAAVAFMEQGTEPDPTTVWEGVYAMPGTNLPVRGWYS